MNKEVPKFINALNQKLAENNKKVEELISPNIQDDYDKSINEHLEKLEQEEDEIRKEKLIQNASLFT